jgi:hypothetical protein
MAAKITDDGLWRVTYGDDAGLDREELVKRQPMRYEQILPGNPKPGDYNLISMSPYKLQQRCAKTFRVGKVLLVADAAHLCNPLYGSPFCSGKIANCSQWRPWPHRWLRRRRFSLRLLHRHPQRRARRLYSRQVQ